MIEVRTLYQTPTTTAHFSNKFTADMDPEIIPCPPQFKEIFASFRNLPSQLDPAATVTVVHLAELMNKRIHLKVSSCPGQYRYEFENGWVQLSADERSGDIRLESRFEDQGTTFVNNLVIPKVLGNWLSDFAEKYSTAFPTV